MHDIALAFTKNFIHLWKFIVVIVAFLDINVVWRLN